MERELPVLKSKPTDDNFSSSPQYFNHKIDTKVCLGGMVDPTATKWGQGGSPCIMRLDRPNLPCQYTFVTSRASYCLTASPVI